MGIIQRIPTMTSSLCETFIDLAETIWDIKQRSCPVRWCSRWKNHRRSIDMVGTARTNPTEEPPMTDVTMSLRTLVESNRPRGTADRPKASFGHA